MVNANGYVKQWHDLVCVLTMHEEHLIGVKTFFRSASVGMQYNNA